MLQDVLIIHPNAHEDGVTTRPSPPKQPADCWKELRALVAHSGSDTGVRRLACWSCKAQCHIHCMMMSNRTQIVRTQATRRWQCTHCSQKPVAESQDIKMAPVLDNKSPGVHQYQLHILQWNADSIHRELQLLEDPFGATNVDEVYIIIVIMVIYRCHFFREHTALSYKKWCGHRIRKNQQINSNAHDGKSYLK